MSVSKTQMGIQDKMNFCSLKLCDSGLISMSFSNRLIQEKSPYLLQHAHNPVDWYSWSEEAFTKATKEDKLIFLSIGYATCHWCHVMEKESFEDVATAKVLNENFVCIKVDREERPDVDKIYMDAIHAMNQQGGWPLNLFLTPELKPLTGGTYFPPVRRYGMKSFKEVLQTVIGFWTERKDEMLKAADELSKYLVEMDLSSQKDTSLPSNNAFHSCFQLFENYFDTEFFGFKTNNQNKFPPSMGISFLLAYHKWTKNPKALEMAEKTLVAMKRGGIYDQLGGGLCRYSTDHEWLVPHFEKMLYDNALFLQANVEAWQLTHKSFYKEIALDIIDYIERDLRTEEGGISCAEDADSEGVEGKFYVWNYTELQTLLGKDLEDLAKFWNITERGNFEHNTIFHETIQEDRDKIIEALGGKSFLSKLQSAKEKLLQARKQRIRPLRDDKILMSWNCLYIQALASAGSAFSDKRLIDLAEKTFFFLKENLTDGNNIFRRYREKEKKYNGTLSDYSEYGLSAMKLFQVSQNPNYISIAIDVAKTIVEKFSSEFGPFYETEFGQKDLIRRSIDGYDGVEPSGNSATARFFLSLIGIGQMTDQLSSAVEGIFSHFHKELSNQGISFPHMLKSLLEFKETREEWVINIESSSKEEIEEIKNLIYQNFLPGIHFVLNTNKLYEGTKELIPILKGRKPREKLEIYFCKNRVCQLPVYTIEDLRNRI